VAEYGKAYTPPRIVQYPERIESVFRPVPIGKLRHHVWVCCWIEKPEGLTQVDSQRPGVFKAYAHISPLGPIELEGIGLAHNADKAEPTHSIVVRTPSDVYLDRNFWIYYKTRFAHQWYRVLRVMDIQEFNRMTMMLCGLTEVYDIRQDPVIQTTSPPAIPTEYPEL
jgi:hypothetical protein